MTLVLKPLNQPDIQGERLWITDNTGEYAASTNEGGWGIDESPNPNLKKSAIVAIALRNSSEGIEALSPVGTAAKYNASAINTELTTFEFFYKNDGHHTMYLMRLPVSADGDNTLDDTPIAVNEGDYYYHTVFLDVYKKQTGQPVKVEDYTEMIDNVDIVQTKCEDFFQSLLSKKRAEITREFKATRKTNLAENPEFLTARKLTEDIISNDFTFRSGLTVEAQDLCEANLDEFNVDAAN